MYRNATLTGSPSWTSVDTGHSVIEYSTTSSVTVAGSELLLASGLAKDGGFTKFFQGDFRRIFDSLHVGDTFTVAIQGQAIFDATGGIGWEEKF